MTQESVIRSEATDVRDLESYRRELLAFCYRFLGCYAEAEDATQETLLRAWRRRADFEGRSSLRTWLYKIATNICLDMQRAPQRRALPMDLAAPGRVPDDPRTLTTLPEERWVGPIADSILELGADPSEVALRRDSVRLALVRMLQVLPPRQRAVIILRDVLAWSADEAAELLDASVASVNSALARARKTLALHGTSATETTTADYDRALLANYVSAFEAFDVDRLVGLLAHDARFSMPPFELWLRGADEIERWWRGPGLVCVNSRTITTSANGQPAVAVYHDAGDGRWDPFAIHVLDTRGGRIEGITHFMGPSVFEEFGLPAAVGDSSHHG